MFSKIYFAFYLILNYLNTINSNNSVIIIKSFSKKKKFNNP